MSLKLPIRKLLKRDLVWLAEHYCRHRHTYLSHYACFLAEKPDTAPMKENVGVIDIETTGLKANYSHMLCWCVKEQGKKKIHQDLITRKEVRDKNDKRLVKSVVAEMVKYDRLVGHYSIRFDIPYIRSRALYYGIPFPEYRDIYHTDTYYMARANLAIHSNRLQAICDYFEIPAKHHPMTPRLWRDAGAGNEKALKTVLMHCREDVESTDRVYELLLDHVAFTKRSI